MSQTEFNAQNLSPEQIDDILARRSQALASDVEPDLAGERLNLLIFTLGQSQYGLDIFYAREIFPLKHLTPLPKTPNFIEGIFNARGQIVAVLNVPHFLGLQPPPPVDEPKIILVSHEDIKLGLLVDDVIDSSQIFRDDLAEPLTIQHNLQAEFIQGIAPNKTIILNVHTMLTHPRLSIT